jgi:hypothetical protein
LTLPAGAFIKVKRSSVSYSDQSRLCLELPRMIVPGCLIAFLLPILGGVLGHWLDGSQGGAWGLIVGFGLGCAVVGLFGWVMVKVKEE